MNKELTEHIKTLTGTPMPGDAMDKIKLIQGMAIALERCKEELSKSQWISVETDPKESAEYLCEMADSREDCDDVWYEVVYFKITQAFGSSWNTVNFDMVTHWKEI